MPSFWSDTLALGIPEIDSEHQFFLELCETLEQFVRTNAPVGEIVALCRAICEHSAEHFSNEEQHLRRAGYALAYASQFNAHVEEHQKLLSVIAEGCARLATAPDDAAGIALAIKAALLEHLLRWDLRYKEFMSGANGLAEVARA